jgi:hypothetical protein
MNGRPRTLGRYVLHGALVGASAGAVGVLLVTVYWLGLNAYLEMQKRAPGIPDVVTPFYVAALYFLVYVMPGAAAGALLGLVWRITVRTARAVAALNVR